MRSHSLATAIIASLGLAAAATPYAHAATAAARPAPPAITAAQLQQLQAQIASLQQQVQALQAGTEEQQARQDAQSEVNVTQAQAIAAAQTSASRTDALARLVNDTSIGGRMFFDLSNIDRTSHGRDTAASGTGFDVKRFYLGVDHQFNDVWSANLTADFQYLNAPEGSGNNAAYLYAKKAYVQGRFDNAFSVRIGSADLPWIPFVEKFYGYRYVENTLTDRLKYGNSADWGAHAFGSLGGDFNYAVSVVNGGGYKHPGRSKGVDLEGRLAWMPDEHLAVAVGAYSGKLGKETDIADAEHSYTRNDVMVAWTSAALRLGGEYFQAKNLNDVMTVPTDKASGWSVWGSVRLAQLAAGGVNAFARYDQTDPSKTLDPTLNDKYWNVGVEFPVLKNFKLATVYKSTRVQNDSRKKDDDTQEFGVWGDLSF